VSICWLALGAFCADLSVLVFGLEEERGKGVFVALRWLAGGERGPGGRSRSNFVVLFAGGRCCCLRYHMVEDSELKECRLGVTVLENYKPVRGGGVSMKFSCMHLLDLSGAKSSGESGSGVRMTLSALWKEICKILALTGVSGRSDPPTREQILKNQNPADHRLMHITMHGKSGIWYGMTGAARI